VTDRGTVRLADFDNAWYDPGRPLLVRLVWLAVNRIFFLTGFPWPYGVKRLILRLFGAEVGAGVVIKNRVNIKYPWNLRIGDHAWIGEAAWIDSLAKVSIGANACLSQGCTVETGNHDWSKPAFDLRVEPVVGRIDNLRSGTAHTVAGIPAHLMAMVEAGGLMPWLKARLKKEAV